MKKGDFVKVKGEVNWDGDGIYVDSTATVLAVDGPYKEWPVRLQIHAVAYPYGQRHVWANPKQIRKFSKKPTPSGGATQGEG